MNALQEAIKKYIDAFDEGPPIFGYEEHEALELINKALESGEPMDDGAEKNIPPGAHL